MFVCFVFAATMTK